MTERDAGGECCDEAIAVQGHGRCIRQQCKRERGRPGELVVCPPPLSRCAQQRTAESARDDADADAEQQPKQCMIRAAAVSLGCCGSRESDHHDGRDDAVVESALHVEHASDGRWYGRLVMTTAPSAASVGASAAPTSRASQTSKLSNIPAASSQPRTTVSGSATARSRTNNLLLRAVRAGHPGGVGEQHPGERHFGDQPDGLPLQRLVEGSPERKKRSNRHKHDRCSQVVTLQQRRYRSPRENRSSDDGDRCNGHDSWEHGSKHPRFTRIR